MITYLYIFLVHIVDTLYGSTYNRDYPKFKHTVLLYCCEFMGFSPKVSFLNFWVKTYIYSSFNHKFKNPMGGFAYGRQIATNTQSININTPSINFKYPKKESEFCRQSTKFTVFFNSLSKSIKIIKGDNDE